MPTIKTTAKEWDAVRSAFSTSIMVDTSLNSLAQNLDGPEWPIKSKDDSPSKYIDLDFESAQEMIAMRGMPPEAMDNLVRILRDTLAFDEPFGEMVEQVESGSRHENALLKSLTRLGIPETFPMEFVSVSPDTHEFCRLEKLETIGQFAAFCQSMAQNVIVGGDFRELLNALAHFDEATLARFLPIRKGSQGVHLPEALALAARRIPESWRNALAQHAGFKDPKGHPAKLERDHLESTEAELRLLAARLSASVFKEDVALIKKSIADGIPLERQLVCLADPPIEAIVAHTLRAFLKLPTGANGKPQGFFARLFGRS